MLQSDGNSVPRWGLRRPKSLIGSSALSCMPSPCSASRPSRLCRALRASWPLRASMALLPPGSFADRTDQKGSVSSAKHPGS